MILRRRTVWRKLGSDCACAQRKGYNRAVRSVCWWLLYGYRIAKDKSLAGRKKSKIKSKTGDGLNQRKWLSEMEDKEIHRSIAPSSRVELRQVDTRAVVRGSWRSKYRLSGKRVGLGIKRASSHGLLF